VRILSVVMPNHVHVLFVQNPEYELQRIIRSWKSYTTRQINSLLQRSGRFWQQDYFDRIVRNQEHLGNCVRYIRRNPNRATLLADEYVLFESEFAKQIE
jgi:putative transposase